MVVFSSHQFSSVQSFSCDQLFVTPWSAACQASLCITNSPSLLELMSIESVMSSNHLIFFIKEWVVEELWLKFRGLCPSPIIWARINPHHALNWCFPGGTVVKNPAANAGDTGDAGLISGSGRSPGEGNSYPFQYSGLENSMDCIVQGSQRVGNHQATFTFRVG